MTGVRVVHNNSHGLDQHNNDAKSIGSYRSTHTSRSSVLERAREYNRKIEQNRRSKSLERQGDNHSEVSAASGTPRSQSAGRMSSSGDGENRPAGGGNRISTRERAMASVQRESNNTNNTTAGGGVTGGIVYTNSENNHNTTTSSASSRSVYNHHHHHHRGSGGRGSPITIDPSQSQATPISRTSNESAYSSHVSRPKPTTPRMSSAASASHHPNNEHVASSSPGGSSNHYGNTTATPTQPEQHKSSRPRHTPHHQHRNPSFDSHGSGRQNAGGGADASNRRSISTSNNNSSGSNNRVAPTPRDSPARSMKSSQPYNNNNINNNNRDENHEAVVTPELLVDALSGHEDGLLAIAERLMEHYDSGYDVMGEAIIDAFADVQKLFQHVVEAAHMEGAAFEASRREEEIAELRKQAAAAGELLNNGVGGDGLGASPGQNNGASGPTRHDEFIDQDVKDILNEAIRKGTNYRNNGKYTECYQLYEQACQSASALLPVDSDHRGRLQLSIARAESMSHERACAILRYAMDDVLRSGLRAGNVPLSDPSQRADVVLNRPQGHSALTGTSGQAGVVQSSEEALNSLVEEMREVMNAPVYNNTPLQSVASRFLAALADAQKAQQKNEEKLEQNLAKLKGDFLLARAEWEEKLNSTQETAEVYKEKYLRLKDSMKNTGETSGATSYLDHARSALASQQQRVNSGTLDEDDTFGYSSIRSSASRTGSHVSLSSGLANHARSIVGSFTCAGGNQRSGVVVAQELAENRDAEIREMAFRHDSGMRDRDRRRNADKRNSGGGQSISMSYSDRSFASEVQSQSTGGPHRRTPHSVASGSTRSKSSRSFREYSRSPQRVDF